MSKLVSKWNYPTTVRFGAGRISELPEVLRLSHRIAVMCEGRLTGILPSGASQEEIMHLATLRGEQNNKPAKGEAK